jgi:anaerobic ribonucleoside-triphosphate reductase
LRGAEMRSTSGVELKNDERTRCEIWTRVMGYHRPVSAWNAGKQSEHHERRFFLEIRAGKG